jgi:hypothetical protein
MIQIRPLAASYVWTVVKQNKSQVSRRPSCRKFPYKMSVGHAAVAPENAECYLRPCC